MTKEELEKDYYADRPTEPYSSDDCSNDWANIVHYAEENLEKAFKRIAELERVNKRISTECHKLVETLEKKQKEIAELENETSELKTVKISQNQVKILKQKIFDAEKELQKYLMDHPELKEKEEL